MKKIITGIIITIIIVLGIAGHIVLSHQYSKSSCRGGKNLSAPIEIPDVGIIKYQEASFEKPLAVMFYVDWCTFCRRFMPIFAQTAKKYSDKFEFAAINCEHPENEAVVKQYDIQGYPALYIIDKDLDFEYQPSMSAMESAENYQKELDKHLKLREKLKK